MGYVPPSGILMLPKNVTFLSAQAYRDVWYANAGYPQMVVSPPGLPRTYAEYRQSLYGAPQRDWLSVMGYGFITASLILGIVVVAGLMSWVLP